MYLYPKDLYEPKYQLLISKRESAGLNHLIYSKVDDIDGLNKILEKYNPNKKRKI